MRNYYFHVTNRQDWGKEIVLFPLGNDDSDNRCYREPNIPRICVAPTVAGCVSAVCPILSASSRDALIYRTKYKVVGHPPKRITDSHITGEEWLLEPTEFILVDSIPSGVIEMFADISPEGVGYYIYNKKQKKVKPTIEAILSFCGLERKWLI